MIFCATKWNANASLSLLWYFVVIMHAHLSLCRLKERAQNLPSVGFIFASLLPFALHFFSANIVENTSIVTECMKFIVSPRILDLEISTASVPNFFFCSLLSPSLMWFNRNFERMRRTRKKPHHIESINFRVRYNTLGNVRGILCLQNKCFLSLRSHSMAKRRQ